MAQFLFSCFVTHSTVFLAIQFPLSFLGFLICKSGDIILVTFPSQITWKTNGIICLKPTGLLGNKMLDMNSISPLLVSTMRENEIK